MRVDIPFSSLHNLLPELLPLNTNFHIGQKQEEICAREQHFNKTDLPVQHTDQKQGAIPAAQPAACGYLLVRSNRL